MPRQPRVFVDGAIYHVYCRVGHGERVFESRDEVEELLRILTDVKKRDGFVVLAWCVMANHYHLVLRSGSVPLWRSMRLVQGRYSKSFNRRSRLYGPLWQGRYKAKLIEGERHVQQVILYVHLNPLAAGLVKNPGSYAWSGHRGLLGESPDVLIDSDEALLPFGGTKEGARRAYASALGSARTSRWLRAGPGQLPWWKSKSARGEPNGTVLMAAEVPRLDALGASSAPERRTLSLDEYALAAAGALGVSLEVIAGPRSGRELTRIREVFAYVGIESYGVRVKDMALRVGKNPGVVSRWANAGAERSIRDESFHERVEQLRTDVRAATVRPSVEENAFVTGVGTFFVD